MEVAQARLIRRGTLRLASRRQVEPRESEPLHVVRHQRAAEVQVTDNVKDLLFGGRGVPPLEEQAAYREVDEMFPLVRDQGIGSLLDPVVGKAIGRDGRSAVVCSVLSRRVVGT